MSGARYEISRNQIKRITKAVAFINAKCDALDRALGDVFAEYMGRETTAISDTVLDIMGVPKDTTVAEGSERGFCRDWFDEKLYSVCDIDDAQNNIDYDDSHIENRIDVVFAKIESWLEKNRPAPADGSGE